MTDKDPRARRDELLKKARDIAANAEAAARDFTDEERTEVAGYLDEVKSINANLRKANESRRMVQEMDELLKAEEAGELNREVLEGTRTGLKAQPGSIGEQFIKSDAYQGLMSRAAGGKFSEKARIQSDPFHVTGGLKALVTSGGGTTDAGVLFQPQQLGVVPYPQLQPKLRDIITTGTTTTDRIEYAQVLNETNGATNAAKTVREATGTNDGSGVKPESGLAFRKASADVVTVAHWIPATKRSLSDAAQVRTLIDGFLRRGLDLEIDRLILSGDADTPVGDEEWNGILNTTGVQAQAWDARGIAATIRKGIGRVVNIGGQVNGVLVSPELDEELDLLQDANDRYYGQGPFGIGPATIWGRPRIVVPALSGRNTWIAGDFSTCVLWDREQATLTATDSHADFFIRNLVAILAEARAAFGIFNPNLLVTGTETAGV
jgi:HK97 family phage major capsid protein